MADEGTTNTPDQKPDEIGKLRSDIDAKLAQISAQLKAQNETNAQVLSALTPKPPKQEIDDSDVFDPRRLRDKIMSEATAQTQEILNEERRKNVTLVNLSREYPELNTDSKFQDAVIEAQKSLPKILQDTADGYELAVMKAVAKQGLLPKSKRPEPTDDFSMPGGSGGGTRSGAKQVKVDEKTLAIAQLLGRDLNDPKVMKGLEEATQRRSWTKYS